MDLQIVEAALLEHPLIDDCVVLVRKGETSRRELVAYIVFAGSFSLEQVQSHLLSRVSAVMMPIAYIPVSSLPLTELGQVDEQALTHLEAIDSDLVQRWEERLQSLPEVEQVAVIVEEYNEKIPPLHLSDLLPEKSRRVHRLNSDKSVEIAAVLQESESKPLAISYGAALQLETDAPTTLSAALLRTALVASKGIIYLKADGSEIVQSYKALLNEAERIKGGLCQLGLKPEDKVIFQINHNWDFIPAFWGCILGGFVPVPISTPPTYEVNSTVQKLHNAWQMLDKPLILTTTELAPGVRSLSDILSLENFQVETVDRLRLCDKDENCHVSQPDDLAILILTSGSTGIPKGVMLSHRNILSNVAASAQMNNFTSDDVSLNWLNLDHVGSLIRCSIRDIYVGSQQIHVPAEAVLEDPLLWLDWIDRYRVTFAWAPNFALGLVNARAEVIQQRRWDLSAVKSILSVAEAIAPKTAQRFFSLLAPHGLSINAMHSAWGMSETCAAVTFSHEYLLNLPSPDYPFVEVGTPIPGLQLRIVDAQNQVVHEDTIGQLQISGAMITCGYYENPALNQEAFTEDGWLKTGDLGYVHQGRLTITGRQKDVIIINGLNHYNHEIEAIALSVKNVEVSYTAAFAVRDDESDTDQLAIVFHTSVTDDNQLVDLLKEIRLNVVREIGVNPAYLIPVKKEAIPKTAIGKIQRSKLKQQFEAGEFTSIVKQIDILTGNANTLPDWFYKKIWRRQEAVTLNTQLQTGYFLVFLDELGLGLHLCRELKQKQAQCICVEAGSEFVQLQRDRYSLDPKNPEHYQHLLKSLQAANIEISQILHLWTYDKYKGEVSSLEALEQAQERGVYSLVFLVQALSQIQNSANIRLSVISSHTQPVSAADEIAYENSPILGIIKTIPQELPWLDCRHIDLAAEVEADATCVLREIQVMQKEREVAYRNQQRLVSRLAKVDLIHEQKQDLPFQRGGMYLLSGGLGEIGVEIAKYLLQHYEARLLLVGRTPLPERSTWQEHIKQKDAISARIQAYLSLEQLGGEVIYEAVDICNLTEIQQVVERAKSNWQCELEGVIHLAGIGSERLLVEETIRSLASTLRPKIFGTWVLHQLLEQQSKGIFISFSSVISFFGAFSVGAYAAANNFLDCFSHYQRAKSKLQSYCFGSSTWAGVGISRGYESRDARFAQGRQVMSAEQGLNSFLASLHHQPAHLLVGLDGNHPYIRRCSESASFSAEKLCAYFTASTEVWVAKLQELLVRDRFGNPSICDFHQIEKMPLSVTGEIDRKQLATGFATTEYIAPTTDIEEKLINIWQKVLNVPEAGIQDNFFELGGTSLLAVRLFSNIEQTFGKRLPLSSLFPSGTVEALAQTISQTESSVDNQVSSTSSQNKSKSSWSSLVEIQPTGSQPPLFCIHPLGGETLCYRDLAKHLGSEQPVYGLQPIGLDGSLRPLTRIEDMASHYIQEIQMIQPKGPYFLLGWSFGGFVVYEIAQQLYSQGEKVGLLGMIDSIRPGYSERSPFLIRIFLHLNNIFRRGPAYIWQKAVGWSNQGKYEIQQIYKRYLNATQHVLDITPHLADNDEHLEVIDANVQALDKYIFQIYPGRMTLFRTSDENRYEAIGEQYDPQFGWGDILTGGIDINHIPGSHLSVMEEPHVQVIAEQLKVYLEKAHAVNLKNYSRFQTNEVYT
ncbi:SDR family NAD(P)-dependent oxidoreductase [Plectonema radiosum]|uniref:SDR family NAD(P)-dependent oxidoreductase n=1 Tax=Plectonema radiosum TaxID=945768 RepID=UPI0021E966DA|nr:SDR family NAD(P)-dependent oxidoreductase [Plectonema radiosum]